MPTSPRCAQKAAHKLCKPSNHVTPRYRVPLPAPTLRVFPTSPNATGLPESMVGMHPSKLNSSKFDGRSEEHTSELQSHLNLVCRLLLEKKNLAAPQGVGSYIWHS